MALYQQRSGFMMATTDEGLVPVRREESMAEFVGAVWCGPDMKQLTCPGCGSAILSVFTNSFGDHLRFICGRCGHQWPNQAL